MTERITVDPTAPWRIYCNAIPKGAEALGTVTRGIGDTGALVRFTATGELVQINAGQLRGLPQAVTARALAECRA